MMREEEYSDYPTLHLSLMVDDYEELFPERKKGGLEQYQKRKAGRNKSRNGFANPLRLPKYPVASQN